MPSHLHLLPRLDPVALLTMELQRRAGVEVRCLLIHDAVTADPGGLPADTVERAAADLRLRGLGDAERGLDDTAIVAAIAEADGATSW